jgi:hypothetical protein
MKSRVLRALSLESKESFRKRVVLGEALILAGFSDFFAADSVVVFLAGVFFVDILWLLCFASWLVAVWRSSPNPHRPSNLSHSYLGCAMTSSAVRKDSAGDEGMNELANQHFCAPD